MTDAFQQFAPAKINLCLHVTGRRPDGYHELDSLVVFAETGDRLFAEPASDVSLEISGPFASGLQVGADNLVIRAAEGLLERLGNPGSMGAALRLEKNLPVSSGIGGGSADAAAAVKLLARLWEVHPAHHDLSGLALGLGADVPVCLAGGPVRMRGVGERLEPIYGMPSLPAILVNPGVAVSTPAVFKKREGDFSSPVELGDPTSDIVAWIETLENTHNDLADPAIALAPEISAALKGIASTPGCLMARMSGSGATCFGLYADADKAASAAAQVQRSEPQWWVTSTVFQGSA